MGVVTTPMYIATSDNECSPQRSKQDQGDNDKDSGSAKYVHLPKGPDNSTIRVDNSTEAGQSGCAGVTATVTQPVTLLLKDLLESPTVGFPRRAAGHPGCAEGNIAKMAFESSRKTYACANCGVQKTHYKLMASCRAEHAYKRECDDVVQYKRICAGCELKYRIEEFQFFSQEEKDEQPEYPKMETVQKDMNASTKDASGLVPSNTSEKPRRR